MQWTSEASAGFSSADPSRLIAPLAPGGYGPDHVNVADQRSDPDSHYSFIRGLIYLHRRHPELGWGTPEIIEQPDPAVLVLACHGDEATVLTLHNLSDEGRTVDVRLQGVGPGNKLVDLWAQEAVDGDPSQPFEVQLDGYGYRWLRIQSETDTRLY